MCCHLAGPTNILNFIVLPSCCDKQKRFLASVLRMVCGSQWKRPFTVFILPHDRNRCATETLAGAVGVDFHLYLCGVSYCTLIASDAQQSGNMTECTAHALDITVMTLFFNSDFWTWNVLHIDPCLKEYHTLKYYRTFCSSEWCWCQNT